MRYILKYTTLFNIIASEMYEQAILPIFVDIHPKDTGDKSSHTLRYPFCTQF